MNRRVKIVALPVEAVMALLNTQDPAYIDRIRFTALPKGYEVESVHGNWQNRCIDVMVSHESFPEVPIGGQPERIGSDWEYITFARLVHRGEKIEPAANGAFADLPVYREVKL